jgi:hypothetical protein
VTALLLLVLLVAVAALAAGIGRALHRRAVERERRRVDALTSLEDRLRSATAVLAVRASTSAPAPKPAPAARAAPGSRGRAALLDALTDAVADARVDGARLSVAIVQSRESSTAALSEELAELTGAEPFEVGAHTVALVVRGGGRAEALGLLARIQAACGAPGDAVELEPNETAVELLARALSAARRAG